MIAALRPSVVSVSRLACVACLLAAVPAASASAAAPAAPARAPASVSDDGMTEHTLQVGERERSYLLHLPPGHDPTAAPRPVVIVFHGGGSHARRAAESSGMNGTADREGFAVVYPEGTGRFPRRNTWNGGDCCGHAAEEQVDDVAFVSALLDELEARHGTDPTRVYLTGLSNGGIIAHHIAARLSERVAAIAPVGGTLCSPDFAPTRPVPVLQIHGAADRFVPVEGGYGLMKSFPFPSVDATLKAWIVANDAEVVPTIEALPDVEDDGCTVERITYAACDPARASAADDGGDGGDAAARGGSAEVVYLRIHGGGHTWPGATDSPEMLGPVCRDVSANDVMWAFFERHARDR